MGDRRMMTKKVTDDDNFMSLSASAQALYLHLSMSADDDGFSNQVAVSMFKAHASIQDLEALLDRRYVYQFENGVIVIRHWRMANALRKDRYTKTVFLNELEQLALDETGVYDFKKDDGNRWLPDGCQMVATSKENISKDNINISSTPNDNNISIDNILESISNAFNSNQYIKAKVTKIPFMSKRYNDTMLSVETYGFDSVLAAVQNLDDNEFFQTWKPSFDWVVDPNNMLKIIEGNYKQGKKQDGDADKEWIERWVNDEE